MTGGSSTYGREENVYRISVGKSERKRPIGTPAHRLEDNIKMGKEIGWEDVEWLNVAQDKVKWLAVVNAVMNLRLLYNAENFLTS